MPVERGFALIALLSLAALIAAFLIASALNLTGANNSNEREQRSMNALRKAKAALIAYAANEQWQRYKTQPAEQPGGLPCPDADDDGSSEGATCSNALSRIGRLPWASIGADDLRDASGERLWYAVSSNFRRLSGTTIINSDTQGLLTVTGAAPASNVVAIVFAPGEAILGQDRVTSHNNVAAYLEGYTAGANDYTFNSIATPSGTANDRLLVITQADLMAAVEPVVAARIERDVKPLLGDYFTKWGAYPFAVPFVAPPAGQSTYLGVSGQTYGLLPLTDTATFSWASAKVASIAGSGTGLYANPANTISPNPQTCSISPPPPPLTVSCTFTFSGSSSDRPDIRLEVFLTNASMAFADTPSSAIAAQFITIRDGDSPPRLADDNGFPWGRWSPVGSLTPTLTFVAQTTGGALTYIGRLQNASDMKNGATITFALPAPPGYLSRLSDPSIDWFISNQWYRQTYYAISPGFAPGGVPSGNPADCNPLPGTPPCLTVNNLPAPTNNKQAILVFAGRALDGQTRPVPGTLANYLEGQNATPADSIFVHRAGSPTTTNDRVVVVSP